MDAGDRDTSVLGRPLGTPTWRLPMDLGPEAAPVAVQLSRSEVGCHLARACVEGMCPELCTMQRRPEWQQGPAMSRLGDRRLESPCRSL